MEFRTLSDGFGVEVLGADLSSLSTGEFEQLQKSFYQHQVLVARAQKLTATRFLQFARRIGPPEPHVINQFHHPEHADILILSNVTRNGQPTGLADAGTYFHTDYSYLDVPARATLLYSIEVPKKGGDTLFANQYAAFDELPADLKRSVDPLVALHHYGNRDDLDEKSRTAASALTGAQEDKLTWVKHRIARPHPVTGRTALYSVSGSSFRIEGMAEAEGVALLDRLKLHATQEKFQLRLKYGVGDVVIWDNASLLHSATLTDPEDPRTLWRITVKEEGRPS
jgi:taurine dioxygenase